MNNYLKGPLIWILFAGILVGAGTTASVMGNRGAKSTYQSPSVSVSSPHPVSQLNVESLASVKALDESFANLADAVKPAVVHIRVQNTMARNSSGERQLLGGEGSGVVFRPDGYIITNDHVVGGFDKVTVILYDGREFEGKVTRAEDSDIAVVKIDAKDLPSLPMADSNRVRTGEFAMAIGAPFGLDNTVTVGHISALQRTNEIPDPNTGKYRMYWDLIQTDAPINMGNSGGPLVNIEGEVVGINTAIFSPTGTSGGIGFAISSNQARLLAETLIEKGKVTRGYLGVGPDNLKIYQHDLLGVDSGALVKDLPSDGPAAMAGVQKGDVIVRVNTIPVASQVDLRNAMIKYGPGTKVEVEVVRDKQHRTFDVTAKEPPVAPTRTRQNPLDDNGNDFQFPEIPDFQDSPKLQNPGDVPKVFGNKARLGVIAEDATATARQQYHLPSGATGAVVGQVVPDTPAAKIGLQTGDLIVGIGTDKITSAEDLANAMKSVKAGDKRAIHFFRYGQNGSTVEMTKDATF